METFIDFLPSDIDRFRWFKNGNRVFCNVCWWVGPDEDYNECPDCNSDRLEWILEDSENK